MSDNKVVNLSGDNTALLRDPSQISERMRRPYMAAMTEAFGDAEEYRTDANGNHVLDAEGSPIPLTDDEKARALVKGGGLARMSEANDLLVTIAVQSWSFDVPVSVDSLLDLPIGDYDKLREVAADYAKYVMPTSFEPSKDEDSPTEPSAA